MAGNMNNGFGGFGDSDDFGFGGGMSGGFGDDFDTGFGNSDGGFGNDNGGFGNNNGGFGGGFGDDDIFSGNNQGNQSQGNQFSDSLNSFDNQSQFQDVQADQQATKKQSTIFIIVGIAVFIVVLIVASMFGKKTPNNEAITDTGNNVTVQQNNNVNVDNIMNDGNSNKPQQNVQNNSQSVVTNKVDDDFTWTLITNNEAVQFNSEYSDMTFTITGIEHKARAVDTNSNLVVITTLQGSISGLSGTYELDVPYNKGVKLVVGNSFTVHVQLGTYNGKTVVGEIKY